MLKNSLLSLKVFYSCWARSSRSIIRLRMISELNTIILTVSISYSMSFTISHACGGTLS